MALLTSPREARPGPARPRAVTRLWYPVLLLALVLPRLYSGSAMWLDEALSVNIARLPVPELFAALRADGSPPFYYLLLHAWMSVFGTSTLAVRALSTVCSVLALPLAYVVGRRLGGPRTGRAATLLLAASPFAIRYATEARMYALVMLLALLGIWAVLRALERPTRTHLAVVALLAGLLALTHYWSVFLVLAGELLLLVAARREGWWGPVTRVAAALPLGAVLFLPWLPSFLYQSEHTGTPWAPPPSLGDAISTVRQWAGPGLLGLLLFLLLAVLAVRACARPEGRRLLLLGLGGLVLGLLVSRWQGAGYAYRYSAALLVPVLLAAAVGAGRLRPRTFDRACAAAAVLALGVAVFSPLLGTRTQAADTAALLRSVVQPGDVVVFCPDQLGPAVNRLLPATVHQVVYPTMEPPERVDWVDYASRNASSSSSAFAAGVSRSTTGAVWLVGNNGYRTYGSQCADLDYALATLRGSGTVVQPRAEEGESESQWVVGYPPAGAPAGWSPTEDQRWAVLPR